MTYRFLASALALAMVAAPAISFADTPNTNAAPAPVAPVAPTATPAAAAPTADAPVAPSDRPATYTIVAGDTLDSIAGKFNTSVKAIAKLNKIPKEKYHKLKIGTVLKIPPAKADTTGK